MFRCFIIEFIHISYGHISYVVEFVFVIFSCIYIYVHIYIYTFPFEFSFLFDISFPPHCLMYPPSYIRSFVKQITQFNLHFYVHNIYYSVLRNSWSHFMCIREWTLPTSTFYSKCARSHGTELYCQPVLRWCAVCSTSCAVEDLCGYTKAHLDTSA